MITEEIMGLKKTSLPAVHFKNTFVDKDFSSSLLEYYFKKNQNLAGAGIEPIPCTLSKSKFPYLIPAISSQTFQDPVRS